MPTTISIAPSFDVSHTYVPWTKIKVNQMRQTETESLPFLQPRDTSQPVEADNSVNSSIKRTGTAWTAVAHIITGIIGSGVLSLAWSISQLGWIAGPLLMLLFAAISIISTFLISNSYICPHPDPEHGPVRNRSYIEAVRLNLGVRYAWICGMLMQINFYGIGIAYIITSAASMGAIQRSNCYRKYGNETPCEFGDKRYMLLFGVVQIFMSQIPDFHSMEWLSVVAAIMSFIYASIGLGLAAAKSGASGVIEGSIYGVATSTKTQKMWLVSQAIGDIAFAFPFSNIVLEIQDTLKSPPPESATMKKASLVSIGITTFFYLSCGGFGYAAFGDRTPGNLLTGFGIYEPYWLIDFANACIVLHLVGGYQVYTQPLFAVVDKWFSTQFPRSTFINKKYTIKLSFFPDLKFNLQRLYLRTAYVTSAILMAMIFPYFNEVLGVFGAINFWPISIFFPVEMYLRQEKMRPWTRKWIVLRTLSIVCFFLTVFATVGSIQGLLAARFG